MPRIGPPIGPLIGPRRGIWIVAAALCLVAASANLQVPLYPTYARLSGLGVGAITLAFACYVAALLPFLIFLGGLSDRIGRRVPILGALASAIAATAIVLVWPSLEAVAIARVFQGLAIALTAGAGTAWAAELTQMARMRDGPGETPAALAAAGARAAFLVSVMTAFGFGAGAMWTSFDLMAAMTLEPGSYHAFLGLLSLCFLGVLMVPEAPRAMIRVEILRWPAFPPGTWRSGLGVALGWAVVGIVVSVVPTALGAHGLSAWVGVALFLINGGGAVTQILSRGLGPARQVRLGFLTLPLGLALVIGGVVGGSVVLLMLGAVLAGSATHGTLYQGGLTLATAEAGAARARAASGFFVYAYVGLCAPAILVGFLSDHLGPSMALILFGGAIAAACVILVTTMPGTRAQT